MNDATVRALLVGTITYAVLTALSFAAGEIYVAAWLPLLKLESQWLSIDGLLCDSMTLVTRNAQHLVQLHMVATVQVAFAGGALPTGAAAHSTTLQAYVLCHPVLIYTLLAAWPVQTWRQRAALLLLGVPCVLIATSLDIPFVLSGLIRQLIFDELAPERADADPLVVYYHFMQGGGRLGLAIVAALIAALFVTGRPAKPHAKTSRLDRQTARSAAHPKQKYAPQLHVRSTKTSPR